MANSNKNWIQTAIKKPGSFTAQAKQHNLSVSQFDKKVKAHPGKFTRKTERRAQLAETLSKLRGNK